MRSLRGQFTFMLMTGALLAAIATRLSAADVETAVDAQAAKVFASMSDLFRQAKSVSFQANGKMTVNAGAEDESIDSSLSVKAMRPNLLAVNVKKGGQEVLFVSDGKTAYTYIPADKQYLRGEAAEQWEEVLADSPISVSSTDPLYLAQAVLSPDVQAALTPGAKAVKYVGLEGIDGVKCHHVRIVSAEDDGVDSDLWVDASQQPIFRQASLDFSRMLSANQAALPTGAKIEMLTKFSDWNLQALLTPSDFSFTPPEDANDVSPPPHALVGQIAPDFNDVKLLDGGDLNLRQHRGKEIVILDFWATWCGPCVKALPTIAAVADRFKDRGVAFYAVNIQEAPEDISAFLKQLDIAAPVPVALDSEGVVAAAYQAAGIPQTVLIDKDGVVQEVHVGLSGNLEKKLTRELEALVAGKPLHDEE